MLGLSKRTDYALIALSYLVERPGRFVPAREIAEAYELPQALLMNLLKSMHQKGLLRSTRGTKGGYQLEQSPDKLTLFDLIQLIEGPIRMTDCMTPATEPEGGNGTCGTDACSTQDCRAKRLCPVQAPLWALQHKFVQFLKDVKLSDLIVPGRRIDVPLELVGLG